MAKADRPSAKEITLIDSQFDAILKALDELPKKESAVAAKQALQRAIDIVYPDMEYEFKVKHPGVSKDNPNATLKDLVKHPPRAEAGSGGRSFTAGIEYLRKRTDGKGFVALFFDLGAPHFVSPKALSSEGFIDRAFGRNGANPARLEEIRAIVEDEYRQALQRTEQKMAKTSRKDLKT